jgi:asparagine synthase (glutamine-hydrolysing)
MLTGWGGDEVASFNGRGHLADQFARLQWLSLLHNLKPRSALWINPRTAKAILGRFWREVGLHYLPKALHRRWRYPLMGAPRTRYLSQSLAAQARKHARPPEEDGFDSPCARETQLSLYRNGHITRRMESWAWSGAEHGLLYVYPLTDRRLMEFAYSLPGDMYRKNGWSRFLFRLAAAPLMSADIVWDRMGTVKSDSALQSFSDRTLGYQEDRTKYFDLHRLNECCDMPWVDIRRLVKAIQILDANTPIRDALAMWQAYQAVQVWHFWQLRIRERGVTCP